MKSAVFPRIYKKVMNLCKQKQACGILVVRGAPNAKHSPIARGRHSNAQTRVYHLLFHMLDAHRSMF